MGSYWFARGLIELGLRLTMEALARSDTQVRARSRARALFEAGGNAATSAAMTTRPDGSRKAWRSARAGRRPSSGARSAAPWLCRVRQRRPAGCARVPGRGGRLRTRHRGQTGTCRRAERPRPATIASTATSTRPSRCTDKPSITSGKSVIRRARRSVFSTWPWSRSGEARFNARARCCSRCWRSPWRPDRVPCGQCAFDVSAGFAASQGQWATAARCYGAAQAQVIETGMRRDPTDESFLSPLIDRARAALGPADFDREEGVGRAWSYEQGVDETRAWLEQVANAEPNCSG